MYLKRLATIVIPLAILGNSIGCRSVGKFGLLSSKDIPVLSRNSDTEYPAPSAAATPTELAGSDGSTTGANTGADTAANTVGGIQLPDLSGIQAPTAPPAAALGANDRSSSPGQDYPATSYQTFPEQPEAAGSTTRGSGNRNSLTTNQPPTFAAPPTTNLAASGNVQQGMYATRSVTPKHEAPPADNQFDASTGNSADSSWPVAASDQSPTNQFATAATSNLSGSRDSDFGGAYATTANAPAGLAAPAYNSVQSAVHTDSGTNVAAIPSHNMPATGSNGPAGQSHYERIANAETIGPWRPGSTSSIIR